MNVEMVNVSQANFRDMFDWSATKQGQDAGCKFCLYWEQPDPSRWPDDPGERETMKRRWFQEVEAEFGPCGKLVYRGSTAIGYAEFAPPKHLPNVSAYACGPPSDQAVLVACLFVISDERKKGVGSALVQHIMSDLRDRGAKAVETFARKDSPNNCSGPLAFWLKHGFAVVREDVGFALVRREL